MTAQERRPSQPVDHLVGLAIGERTEPELGVGHAARRARRRCRRRPSAPNVGSSVSADEHLDAAGHHRPAPGRPVIAPPSRAGRIAPRVAHRVRRRSRPSRTPPHFGLVQDRRADGLEHDGIAHPPAGGNGLVVGSGDARSGRGDADGREQTAAPRAASASRRPGASTSSTTARASVRVEVGERRTSPTGRRAAPLAVARHARERRGGRFRKRVRGNRRERRPARRRRDMKIAEHGLAVRALGAAPQSARATSSAFGDERRDEDHEHAVDARRRPADRRARAP